MRGEDILNVLLDVEWVVGSFVADSSGQLLLHQMPPEFAEQELERTTLRLASIVRCAELCELGVEQCAFSLNRYQLAMTRFRGGFLCVMVEAPVNRRALEMATRIAVEALPQLVDSLIAAGSTPPEEVPPPRKAQLEREGEAPHAETGLEPLFDSSGDGPLPNGHVANGAVSKGNGADALDSEDDESL
ncbi:MAG TPA: hypothetical protein VFS67_33280 [Polyangiaceae bacterium]|nr:hypothetical protein [Polyangiaceae bacterium]